MPMDEAALLSRLVDQDAILTAKQLCVEFSEPLPAAGAFLQSLFEKYAASNGLCAVVCQSAGSAVRLERVTGTSIPSESRVVSVQRQGGRSLGQAVANQLDHDRQTWLRREDDVLLRGLAGVQRSEGIVSGPRKAVRSVPAEEQGPSRTLETVKQTKANEFFAPRSGAKTDPPVKRSGALQFKPDVRKADAVLDEDEDDIEVEEQGALRPSEPAPAGKPAAPRSEPVKSSSSNAKRVVSSSSSDASSEDEDAQPRTKSPAKPKPKHKSPVKPKAKSPTAKAKPGKSKKAASESSSSGEEEMGTEAGKDGGDEAKTKKAKHKNKKSRVVDSDLDSSEEEDLQKRADKTKAREERKAQRAADKEADKLREKEETRRRQLEDEHEKKAELLARMGGSAPSPQKEVRTKKVMVTKTFVDEDGYDVTVDVMEEVDVMEKVPVASQQDVERASSTAAVPQPAKAAAPAKPKPAPPSTSAGTSAKKKPMVNGSIMSFFKKPAPAPAADERDDE